jgi:hypothetical protein
VEAGHIALEKTAIKVKDRLLKALGIEATKATTLVP